MFCRRQKIEGVELAEKIEKLKIVERYLRNAQYDGFDRDSNAGTHGFRHL